MAKKEAVQHGDRGSSTGVRLTSDELATIRRLAGEEQRTVSSWIRLAILDKLARCAKH